MSHPARDLFGEPIPEKPKAKPQQLDMFAAPSEQKQVAQFGLTARPQISLSPTSKLELIMQGDPPDGNQQEEPPRLTL